MPSQFRKRIQKSLDNPALQSALDHNAERRGIARVTANASLPEELNTLRQRAHALRAKVISNLDQYLKQFTSQAEVNGMHIHYARTAAEAVETVLQIARNSQAKLVAKSKTMVGEEIQINPALEAEGLKVVETDLGEYIVQLRGEPPAHIITPAVHLSRAEVGQTFQEKLGVAFTEDIPTLTAIARKVLRQAFLEADIGISGVNFGIAESGGLCLLTNEGNGRMVTTLPKVHIALMGIERMVPTYADLALMLELLPRSATGQKLTVYTSLIRGPRQPDEEEGPRQRHLVLVDNGRSALRESNLAEILYCIRCGACLNACPVFREIGGHAYQGTSGAHTPYSGPIGSVLSPGLFGISEFGNLARASSLCGACKEACPVDIDLPKLLLRLRAEEAHPGSREKITQDTQTSDPLVPPALRWALRAFSWTASSPRLFSAAQRVAGILSRLVSPISKDMKLPAFSGWGSARDLARPAVTPFHAQFGSIEQKISERPPLLKESEAGTAHFATNHRGVHGNLDLVERFEAELTTLGGEFVRCKSERAAGLIAELLQSLEIDVVQSWEKESLPAGISEWLSQAGIQVRSDPDPDRRAGLTGALAGITETGSLVLAGGRGRPMSASLLPELHIAVLRAKDICEDLAQALSLSQLQAANSAVLITGPSRTADIEMTLTIGVHGPGRLVVFCLDE